LAREIKTLEDVDLEVIRTVFNQSFSDYFTPFKLAKEQLISKMLADKTDLSLSVGVFDDNELIAFVLHGFDIQGNDNVVYNGGTGVISIKRGSGLTKQMYQFILPILKEKGVNKLLLEVIDKNIQAIKSYKKSGFETKRDLICYKGEIEFLKTNHTVTIGDLKYYDIRLMESFWDSHPTWQNSMNTIIRLKDNNVSLGAFIENTLVGYVIYNPTNKRIHQIAVCKDKRRLGIASTLLSKLINDYDNTISIINVNKSSKSINKFLQNLGFEIYLNQLEMELQLKDNK
jgi:ribosomal protein S18 acetylase RimI-like enzyme